MINTYQKKPITLKACLYTYPASIELRQWLGDSCGNESIARHIGAVGELEIKGLEDGHDGRAKHVATHGDYIIKGVKGEFYACKPDIFKDLYDLVDYGSSNYIQYAY